MSLYEKNKQFLKEQLPYIEFGKTNISKLQVLWEKSAIGEDIIAVEKENNKIYINSRYEAELWAKQWVEQFENVNYRTKFFVIGIGNGMYLKALHEKYPDNMIIACEIYSELEESELEKIDFTSILKNNIFLIMGPKRVQLYRNYLSNLITYADYNQIVFCTTPNYDRIDEKVFEIYRKMYIQCMDDMFYCRNTIIADEEYRRESFLNNLFIFPRNYVLGQLLEKFEENNMEDRTAIIVSAGPSLDKNISQLKLAKNKALLIAVDAAAKPMVKAGVYPDLIVTIDPIKDESIFQEGDLVKCPMVASMYSHYKITRQQEGPVYFPTAENDYISSVYEKYGYGKYRVASGGSVANNAFSLGVLFGFKTIILVGQDLGYPDGKVHASHAVYKNCLDNEIEINNRDKYYEIEANDGGTILTEANMDAYRKWFEEQAVKGEVRIINATEGGAKIHGAEYMTLQEALKTTCYGKEEINFSYIMRNNKSAFTKEQQDEIYAEYAKVNKKIDVWVDKLKKGIRAYEKLDLLNRKGKYHTSEYKKLTEELGQLTKEFSKSDIAAMLNQWGNKTEYEVLDTLTDNETSLYNEVKTIIDGGIKMYQSYIDNSFLLKEKWSELLNRYGIEEI